MDKISLNEYENIFEKEDQELIHEFAVIVKTVSFLCDQFPKLKAFLRFLPRDPELWTEAFPDDELDFSKLSGNCDLQNLEF